MEHDSSSAEPVESSQSEIITDNASKTAPLFQDRNEVTSSEISFLLEDKDPVNILEQFDDISLIEFIEEDGTNRIIHKGYIDNQYMDINNDEPQESVITSNDGAMIPLFQHKKDVEELNIITLLEDGDNVTVLESLEGVSFIEFSKDDESEIKKFEGYIDNEHLAKSESDTQLEMFINSGEDDNVPVYENEDFESSKILISLHTNDRVNVLKSFDKISFISFSDEDSSHTWEGYIDNKYLSEKLVEIPEDNGPHDDEDTSKSEKEMEDDEIDIGDEKLSEDESNLKNPKDIALFSTNQTSFYGVALKNKTNVYEKQSLSSKVLKSYNSGSILKYRSLNNSWYEATVIIGGKATIGYINKADVDTEKDTKSTLHGVALQSPTKVYSTASTGSKPLKAYSQGTILKYKTFTKDWYEATVLIKGKATTGYIHKSHVQDITGKQQTLNGIGLKSPTYVYSKASTSSKPLKSYSQGSILKYKTFTKDWYEATVLIKGKATTGYIHKSHVEDVTNKQQSLTGIGLKSPTHVYSKASTSSKTLKSYSQGTILMYKTFTNDWYEATVYINGKKSKGYIYKSHVDDKVTKQKSDFGVALKNSTNIYSRASTNSKTLKSYKSGTILKYKTFTKDWYEAVVYIDGKSTTGYIHKNDVGKPQQLTIQGIGLGNPTTVYNKPFSSAKTLKTYNQGSILKVRTYANNWYEATVIINGKATTGYIKTKDIEKVNSKKDNLQEFAIKQPTNVYSKASKNASILKSYKKGQLLKFNTFSKNWYQASVKVNGKYVTGYIHKDDVGLRSVNYKKANYNITFNNYVNKQMNNAHKTNFPEMYVHKNALKKVKGKWVVDGTNWNVRSKPNTNSNSKILGKMDERKTMDPITVHGSSGNYYRISTWILANKEDTEYYLNPANFPKGSNAYYQFLVLSESVNFDSTEVNQKILADKGIFKGKADSFAKAAKKHNVNELYLISHAMLETGNGKSDLATGGIYKGKMVYNMYGIGAADTCKPGPYECGLKYAYDKGWTTPEKAIIGGAEFIGENYISKGQDTLYKMRWNPGQPDKNGNYNHQYATDIGWAMKQTDNLKKYYNDLNTYQQTFEEPSFK